MATERRVRYNDVDSTDMRFFLRVGFTVCMKLSNGFKNVKFTILTFLITALGIFLLSTATKTLPLGVAYAVWTGLGTLFTVLFGILVFKESRDRKKLFFMCMVVRES